MKYNEAVKTLKKEDYVSIVTSNGFRYKGKIISINADTLLIIDKFSNNVSIRLNEIAICQRGKNELSN